MITIKIKPGMKKRLEEVAKREGVSIEKAVDILLEKIRMALLRRRKHAPMAKLLVVKQSAPASGEWRSANDILKTEI